MHKSTLQPFRFARLGRLAPFVATGILAGPASGGAQVIFEEHVISTTAFAARSVYATDVDGDGDTDVLSASRTTTRSPGTRTTAARRPHSPSGSSRRRPTCSARSMRRTWTGTGTPTCSRPLYGRHDRLVRERRRLTTRVHRSGSSRRRPTVLGRSMRRTWTGTGTPTCSRPLLDDKIAWYENDGGLPPAFTERIISTTADGASRSMRRTWTGTGTPTCSRPLGTTTRSPGTRTTAAAARVHRADHLDDGRQPVGLCDGRGRGRGHRRALGL